MHLVCGYITPFKHTIITGMNHQDLTIDSLLARDGFISFDKKSSQTQTPSSLEEICAILHRENPIRKLRSFSLFVERKCADIEYENKYRINSEKRRGEFLMSLTYTSTKQIDDHNTITITHNDIDFDIPMYYLSFALSSNQDENIENYMIELKDLELKPSFRNGFIHDENQFLYDIFGSKHLTIFRKLLQNDSQLIFNNYTSKIVITFDKQYPTREINVRVKLYNIYVYGGFFNSGWLW